MTRKTALATMFALVLCLCGDRALALTLTNNESVADGVLGGSGGETIRTNLSSAALFWWADANGDGTPGDAVSAGLNLGNFNLLRNADTNGITLSLNDGTSDGAITWGGVTNGQISTARTGSGTIGFVTINGASDIACQGIYTHSTGNYGLGGPITITQNGNLIVTNLHAFSKGNERAGGNITLTGGGPAAGYLQVSGGISNAGQLAGAITVRDYSAVHIGAAGISCYKTGDGNGSAVAITNIGAGGVTLQGALAHADPGGSSSGTQPNSVVIGTAGNVQLPGIDTHTGNGTAWVKHDSGVVTITAGGSVTTTGNIDTYMLGVSAAYTRNAGAVTITAGGAVQLAGIDTHNAQANYAGNLQVAAGGDIRLRGAINLHSPYGTSRCGNLALTTTAGGGGTIYVGDETTDVLDCKRANLISFNSASAISYISGALTNFPTGWTNGTGTAANPYVTTQKVLRLPAGQVVYYNAAGSLNGYLGGFTYQVADLNGTSGVGGLLTPEGMALVPGTLQLVPGADGGGDTNDFRIGKFEVDAKSFALFLNENEAAGLIDVSSGLVTRAGSGELYFLADTAAPRSHVVYAMGETAGNRFAPAPGKEGHPVIFVSWFGAAAYCNWLSGRENLAATYDPSNNWSLANSAGYRLPTGTEWLKAAAWNKTTGAFLPYGTGSATLRATDANYLNSGDPCETNAIRTTSVGSYLAASPYDLHDASGNVWEWCHDLFDAASTNPATDAHALRGGGWGNLAQDLTTAARIDNPPGAVRNSVGFRVVKPATN